VPVVVTGASGFVGPVAVSAFLRNAPEVRAVVGRREAAEPLRALGAKVAVASVDDAETLEVVLRGAHTVCHLVEGLLVPDVDGAVAGTLRPVLSAAVDAGVERVLFVSYPGASATSPNGFLASHGRAEEAIAGSGLEHAVIRSAHVYGPSGAWLRLMTEQARRTPSVVLGRGTQRLAPVFVDDLAEALAGADDRAGRMSGVWSLQGPDVVTADGLADLLSGRRRRKRHAGRLKGLTDDAVEVLAADSLADDVPDAAREFGLTLTPLADGLARSLGPVED
jgi:NADH dehydrogenase